MNYSYTFEIVSEEPLGQFTSESIEELLGGPASTNNVDVSLTDFGGYNE